MALDFPNTPTVGQVYENYTWDGEKWVNVDSGGGTGLPPGIAGYHLQANASGGSEWAGFSPVTLGVTRPWLDKARDIVSVADYGASPSASAAANTVAINAVEADSGVDVVYVPGGTHQTDFTPYQVINKRYIGPGKFEMSGYAQAPMRSFITSPQPVADSDRTKMFDALGTKQHQASYSFVGSGANPVVLPSVYTNFVEWSARVHVHDYTAGFNVHPADHSPGRSGAFVDHTRAYHGGGGDLVMHSYYGEVYAQRPGATHFLANPALAVHNASLGVTNPSGAGCYLQGSEYVFADRSDAAVSVIDSVRNYHRNNAGTDISQVWIHDRPQSGGSVAADCVFSIAGNWRRGLDTTPADFGTDKAAIALKTGDRVYFAASATPDSLGINWFAGNLGGEWITAGADSLLFTARGNQYPLIVSAHSTSSGNGLQIIASEATNPVDLCAQGPGASIGIALIPKGTGAVTAGALVAVSDHITVNGYAVFNGITQSNHLWILDGTAAPGATPGIAQIYVDSADGDLKVKFGDGVVKTLAVDT